MAREAAAAGASFLDFGAFDGLTSAERKRAIGSKAACFFFWPVAIFEALERRGVRSELDMFAEAVLRLIVAGARFVREIALDLQLDDALVARIMQELAAARYLDENWLPTERGTSALRVQEERIETRHALLFADAVAGTLFPRCARTLVRARVSDPRVDKRSRTIASVTIGESGGKRPALAIGAPERPAPLPFPSGHDVETALAEFRAAVRRHELRSQRPSDDFTTELDWGSFEVVDSPPMDGFVLTQAWPAPDSERGWEVADPFGLGIDDGFAGRVWDYVRQDPARTDWFARVFSIREPGDAATAAGAPDGGAFTLKITVSHAAALAAIGEKLPRLAAAHPEIATHLIDVETQGLVRRELAGATALPQRQVRAQAIRSQILAAQTALERMCEDVRARFPTAGCWQEAGMQEADDAMNAAILSEAALVLGFAPERDGTFPPALVRTKLGKIRSSAETGEGSLNARLLAALLTALRHRPAPLGERAHAGEAHPFWAAAVRYPKMLLDVNRLARARDRVAHDARDAPPSDFDVDLLLSITYRTLEAVLFAPGADGADVTHG